VSYSGEKRRPNANYKLSKENIEPDKLTYHYDRETRLAKSSRIVQDIYKKEQPKRLGFLRTLVGIGNRPRTLTFISIIMCCVLILFAANLTSAAKSNILGGNQLIIQAVPYEGIIIVTLYKKSTAKRLFTRSEAAYTGAVDITALPAKRDGEEQGQMGVVFNHQVVFSREKLEQYRFVLPFDTDELLLVFQTEKDTLGITVEVVE
jgi:hypothetical protein